MQNTIEAKAAAAAYAREWRKRNPDKCREYQRRYWERKAAEAAKKDDNEHGQAVTEQRG